MSSIQLSTSDLWQNYQVATDEVDKLIEKGSEKWPASFTQHYFKDEEFAACENWLSQLEQSGIENLVVIGMGGSSLGAKALQCFYGSGKRAVHFLEGTHPQVFAQLKSQLNPQKSAVLFISKSGGTLESRSQLELIRQHFVGISEYYITSNPDKIADIVQDESNVFAIPTELGGRFSIVSPVGILPGLFMGADMVDFMQGFKSGLTDFAINKPLAENPAKKFSLDIVSHFNGQYDGLVFWVYSAEMLMWV